MKKTNWARRPCPDYYLPHRVGESQEEIRDFFLLDTSNPYQFFMEEGKTQIKREKYIFLVCAFSWATKYLF